MEALLHDVHFDWSVEPDVMYAPLMTGAAEQINISITIENPPQNGCKLIYLPWAGPDSSGDTAPIQNIEINGVSNFSGFTEVEYDGGYLPIKIQFVDGQPAAVIQDIIPDAPALPPGGPPVA